MMLDEQSKKFKADFHIHTHHSDGSDTLKQVIKKAKAAGITHIAIANHDTIFGWKELREFQVIEDIQIIPAIEVSCFNYQVNKKVHVLAYGLKHPDKILKKCDQLLEQRSNNTIDQLEILIANGFPVSHKELREKAYYSSGFYKQHIMNIFIGKGLADSVNGELYQEIFKAPGICSHLDIQYIDVFEAIKAIKDDGGIAVIAHPGQTKSFTEMDTYIAAGIEGIECYHFDHQENDVNQALAFAEANNLLIFGGSDYHGSNGPDYLGKVYVEDAQMIRAIMKAIYL